MSPNPSLVSLWLVDNVSRDENGRPTLHGVFNRVVLPTGATEYTTPFTVFFSVTAVRSRCECQLKLTDLSDLESIYSRPVILDEIEPSEVLDMTVRVNRIPLRDPGEYAWELFHGAEMLGCTRMTVVTSE